MIKRFFFPFAKKFNDLQDNLTIGRLDQLPNYHLEEKHVKNCKVVPNRINMLEMLPKEAIVAEVGVANGDFSGEILNICNPKELHLIDNWPANTRYKHLDIFVRNRFHKEFENNTIKIHKGKSVKMLETFSDHYFDWIYIDTVHDYKVTKAELEISLSKIKRGGIICGDDYTTRSRRYGIKYGVIEAVHEFCVKHNWEFIFLTAQTNGHNNFALKQIL